MKESTGTPGKTILRLLIALVIGFFLGAFTAGVLEAFGLGDFEFFSLRANVLIAIWTAIVWWFLSQRASGKAAKDVTSE